VKGTVAVTNANPSPSYGGSSGSERPAPGTGPFTLSDLLDQFPAGLLVAEAPSGRIVVYNGEAERILGHPLIPVAGTAEYVEYGAVHADGRRFEPEDHPLSRALVGETCHHATVRYRRGDGRIVRLSVNAAPIRDASGRIVAAVTTFADVTERLSTEESLRLGLERLVRERTLELTERSAELDRVNAELRALSDGLEEQVRTRTAELEASRARLVHQAQHDHLTGLPNRILLEERVERAVAAASRYGRCLAVLFLDLDGFKGVNDTFGHSAGDEVLRQVAGRFASSLRSSDTLARMGGDEFVALVSDLQQPSDALEVAHALLDTMTEPYGLRGRAITLTVSIGVSVFPDDALEAVVLQQHADTAMYRAKKAGKNRVAFFAPQGTPAPSGGPPSA
jgi:diguanylate cyclase (GGDEF)-like protein/PAS domain S-box-containing protein